MSGTVKQAITNAFTMKVNTVSNTALAISNASWSWGSTDLSTAVKAVISANAKSIVATFDGTDPTTTLGLPIAEGASLSIDGNLNIQNMKLIRATGDDATVTIILWK